MTKKESFIIECPNCGEMQSLEVWRSINVTLDPDAKKILFGHHFNETPCQKCGNFINPRVPFMYHDMERKIAVYCFPPEALHDRAFFSQFKPDGSIVDLPNLPKELSEEAAYFNKPHIVFSLNELRLYVAFRDMLYELNRP